MKIGKMCIRDSPVPCLQGVDDIFMFRVGVGSSGVPDGEDGFKQHIVFGLKFKMLGQRAVAGPLNDQGVEFMVQAVSLRAAGGV